MENNFGKFLKQKRQEKNLTQKELSKLLYVSESAVSKWEKNVAHPDITIIPKLSEILGVSEHELITASIDENARNEKLQAKKWRKFSKTWELFFYISYSIALLTCFICNLAINKTLSWFFIVFAAILLAFSFTNLPKYITKYKLVFIPLFNYLALTLLLGLCAIKSNGNWFFIAELSILLGLTIIFMPIYISKYKLFEKIKKYNDFVSIAIDFILLNILLIVINICVSNYFWYFKVALPITAIIYLVLNILLSIRFLKVNKLIKTSIILFIINVIYIIPSFIKVKNISLQKELNELNIFKSNLNVWSGNIIKNNIHLIVFLTILACAIIFLIFGLIATKKNKK